MSNKSPIGVLARLLVVVVVASCLVSASGALQLRFQVEPPPFAFVSDRNVSVVPCAADSRVDLRWYAEDYDSASSSSSQLVAFPTSASCTNNRSLVIIGSKSKKQQCGFRLPDDEWLTPNKHVFCALSSNVGTLLSRPVRLVRVPELGKPTVRAVSNPVYENGAIHLRCQVLIDKYHLQYSWLVDGSPLRNSAIANRASVISYGDLYIRNATEADTQRRYYCTVTNTMTGQNLTSTEGPRLSFSSSSAPFVPLKCEEHSTDASLLVNLGGTAELTCPLCAYPTPTFTWSYGNNQPVDKFERLGGLMVIRNVQATDAGDYYCTAANSAGRMEFKWTLRVKTPLRVSIVPAYVEKAAGESVEFVCSVEPQSEVEAVIWYRNGKRIPVAANDDRGLLIQLSNVSRADRGIYQCMAIRKETAASTANTDVSSDPFSSASSSAFLNMTKERPEILFLTADQLNVQKDTYARTVERQLECRAAGIPLPSIAWFLDGEPLSSKIRSANLDDFTVASHINITVRNDTSGRYTCEASNSQGKAARTTLLFAAQASGMRPLRNVTSFVSSNLTVGCYSLSPLRSGQSIGWKRLVMQHGRDILSNIVEDRWISIDASLNGASKLVFTSVQQSHAGWYQCDVADERQTHTQRLYVAIDLQPSLSVVPVPMQPQRGEALTLNCLVSNANYKSIRWYKDSKLIAADSPGLQLNCTPQLRGSCIVIRKLDFVHNGIYSCEMEAQFGNETSPPYALSVQYAPQFEDGLPASSNIIDMRVLEGDEVMLDCKASGNPKVTVTWESSNNGRDLKTPQPIAHYEGSRYAIHPNDSLQILHAEAADSNLYRCTVSNKFTQASSIQRIFNVSVFVPVRTETDGVDPVNLRVRANRTAELQCRIRGDRPVAITWYHDRQPVSIGIGKKKYNILVNDSDPNVLQSTLLVMTVTRRDSGLYTCNASNKFTRIAPSVGGSRNDAPLTKVAAANFTLTVLEPPARIDEVAVVNVTESTAELTWKAPNDGHSKITMYIVSIGNSTGTYSADKWVIAGAHDYKTVRKICLYLDEDEDVCNGYQERYGEGSDNRTRKTASMNTVFLIDKLEPAFKYTINISAVNSEGESPINTLEFTTAEAPPDAPPIIKHVIAKNDTSLFIEWLPPPVLNQRGDVVGYHIHYERCGMAEKLAPLTVAVPPKTSLFDPRIGMLNVTLSPLRKFSKYCVRINAFNARGSGPYSAIREQFTAESVPSEPPRSVQCSHVTKSSMQISWEPPQLPALHGVLQMYTITAKPVAADENEESTRMYEAMQTEVLLSNLDPATNYSITVQARTRVGDGVASQAITCSTSQAAPSKPQQVRAIQLGATTVLVIWQPPARANGRLTGYETSVTGVEEQAVTDCKQAHPEAGFFSSRSDCTNNCGKLFCGLLPGRSYEFAVSTATLAGRGEPNGASITLSSNGQLKVAFGSLGEVISAAEGDRVMLNCLVIGRPSRTFWTLGNNEMALLPDKHQRYENNSLVIKNLNRSDRGNYTCNADNEKVRYELIVTSGRGCRAPEKPRIIPATITQNSIQIRWSTRSNGNCPINGFEIRWFAVVSSFSTGRFLRVRRQAVDASQKGELTTIHASERSKQFAALKCGTIYEFALTANNLVGKSLPEVDRIKTLGTNLIRPRGNELLPEVNSTRITLAFDAFLTADSCPLTSANVTLKDSAGNLIMSQELNENDVLSPLRIAVYPQTAYLLKVIARSDVNEVELDEIPIETPAYRPSNVIPVRETDNVVIGSFNYLTIVIPVIILIIFIVIFLILAKFLCNWRAHHVAKRESVEAGGAGAARQNSTESNQRRLLLSNVEPLGEATPATGNRRGQHVSPNSEIRTANAKGKPTRTLPPRDGRSRAGVSTAMQRQVSNDSNEIKKKRGLLARAIQTVLRSLFGSGSSEYEDVPIEESNIQSPAARQDNAMNANNQSASDTLDNGNGTGSQSQGNDDSTIEDLPPAGRSNRLAVAAAYRHRSASYEARNRPLPTTRHERTTSDRSNLSRSQYYSGGEYATLDDTAIGGAATAQQETVGIECSKSVMTESWVYSGGDPSGMNHSINTAASIDSDGNIQPYATFHLTPKRSRGVARTFEDDPYRLTMPRGKGLQPSNTSAFVRPQAARPGASQQPAELFGRQRSIAGGQTSNNQSDALRHQAIMRRIQSQNDASNMMEMAIINVAQGASNSAELTSVPRIFKPIATNPAEKSTEKQQQHQQSLIGVKLDSAFRPVPNRYTVRGSGKDGNDGKPGALDSQKSCDAATSPLDVKSDTIEEGDSSHFTTSECTASALTVHGPAGAHHRAASATTMSSNHDELSQLYDSIKGRAQQYTLPEDVEETTLADGRTHKLATNAKRELATEDEQGGTTTCETESSPDGPNKKQSSGEESNVALNPTTSSGETNRNGQMESGGSSDSGIRNFTQLPPLPNEHRQATCEVLLCRPEAKTTQAAAQNTQQPGQKPSDALVPVKTPKKHRKPKLRGEPCDDIHVANEDQQLVPFQGQPSRHSRTMTDNSLVAAHQHVYGTACTVCTHLPPTAPILPNMMQPGAMGIPHAQFATATHPYHTYYPHHAGTMPYGAPMQVPLEYYASYSPAPGTASHIQIQAGNYGMAVLPQHMRAFTLGGRPGENESLYYSSTPEESQITNVLNCVHSAFATGRPNFGISNPVALMAPNACHAGAESNGDYDSVADSASQERLNETNPRQQLALTHHSAELPKSAQQPTVFELRVPKICHQVQSNAVQAPLLPVTFAHHTPRKSYNAQPGTVAVDDVSDPNYASTAACATTISGENLEFDSNRNLQVSSGALGLSAAGNIASSIMSHPSSEHYDDTIDV